MLTDRSVSALTGTTSVQAAAANMQRKFLLICTLTASDVWLNFGSAAVKGIPSIRIQGNSTFVLDQHVPPESVWLLKDGTGTVDVVVKEG